MTDFDRLYLARRPPLGSVNVVDIAGETFERKVLAASLQGVVNRREARLYLVDGTPGDNRPWETDQEREAALSWLRLYEDRHGVKRSWEGGLDQALTRFGREAKGYVVASAQEPWTVNAATTIAAAQGALVAFESDRPALGALGLAALDTLAGRWKDATACYLDLEAQYAGRMDHPSVAILAPSEHRLRDFLIQQGVLTIYARPTLPEWDTVKGIFGRAPQDLPVYGYVALTGAEELVAVKALSEAGKFLVPSDTTSNLSFHLAVVPDKPRAATPPAPAATCDAGALTATVAISDGDNLAIPLNRYPWPTFWNSPARGRVPLGWSFSMALGALAPAVADHYLSTATDRDEWVAMLGIGYAHPAFMPDRDFFLGRSFARMRDVGLSTFWSLDVALYAPSDPTWLSIARNAAGPAPSGVLVGYVGLGGAVSFRTAGRLPALVTAATYDDTPATIAARLRDFAKQPESSRPAVVFIGASVWGNTLDGLAAELEPLSGEGVRLVRPADAFACVP